jgi:hypothetical protein
LVWRPQTDRSGREKGPQKDRSIDGLLWRGGRIEVGVATVVWSVSAALADIDHCGLAGGVDDLNPAVRPSAASVQCRVEQLHADWEAAARGMRTYWTNDTPACTVMGRVDEGIAYMVVTVRDGHIVELKGCADRPAAVSYAQGGG